MSLVYHILNGDALQEQLPKEIDANQIIMRECLIEGPLSANNFNAFIHLRSNYLANTYPEVPASYYEEQVVPEFKKMLEIPDASRVYLWFEDDVFCQTNLWFLLHVLKQKQLQLYLIRPKAHTPYSFAGLLQHEFIEVAENPIALNEVTKLSQLWEYYKQQDWEQLVQLAENLEYKYPFIKPAAEALIARIPTQNTLGKPKASLQQITKELPTQEFGPIFKEFCKREAIYGYGDLQVRRMYDELLEKN